MVTAAIIGAGLFGGLALTAAGIEAHHRRSGVANTLGMAIGAAIFGAALSAFFSATITTCPHGKVKAKDELPFTGCIDQQTAIELTKEKP